MKIKHQPENGNCSCVDCYKKVSQKLSKIISITQARKDFFKIVEDIKKTGDSWVITLRGKPVMVIVKVK